jgi:predicted unusual protein kinase regulating ubiquinone biosynthesis (AarF/ABC1/UbiB family)
MTVSLKAPHVKRYKDIARLLVKYGRSDLIRKTGLHDALEKGDEAEMDPAVPLAEQLAADLERLGPTYVKVGQLLSTRADLLPLPFMEALSRLQDRVEPFPFEDVEDAIHAELGVRISKAFSEFDPEPLAAASLGQVHRASMRDGRQVAVKVQRPGIRRRIEEDLEALREVAAFFDKHSEAGRRYEFGGMVEEIRKTLLRELDYRQEAKNLATLAENLGAFDKIVVPAAVEDYTTERVLTTAYVRGHKITKLSHVVQTEIDGSGLADELFRAYLQQILIDGFVHADPHPGNVFLTDDGRIALIDLGMVARVIPSMQERLLQLLLAVSEGHADEAAAVAIAIGQTTDRFDEPGFRRKVADLVSENQDQQLEHIQVGKVVLAITKLSADSGIRVPPELTMLGKTLLNLDLIGRTLDPRFDPNAAVRSHAVELTQQRMRKSISPGRLFGTLIEMKDFLENLPLRINRILDTVASNGLEVKVDAIDEKLLMEGFQKVANRVAVGVILAALIVGAAMLMKVETSFRILGYPGLAMIFFIVAAGMGLMLVFDILLHDLKANRK